MATHPSPYPTATPEPDMGDNGNGTRYVTWREFEDWRDDLRHQMRDLQRGQSDIGRKLDEFILNVHKNEANELRAVLREVADEQDKDDTQSFAKRMATPGWVLGILGFVLATGTVIADILTRS
jgi:hypothetical protein